MVELKIMFESEEMMRLFAEWLANTDDMFNDMLLDEDGNMSAQFLYYGNEEVYHGKFIPDNTIWVREDLD